MAALCAAKRRGEIRQRCCRVKHLPLWGKCLGVRAVRAHFDGVVTQNNAECENRNAEYAQRHPERESWLPCARQIERTSRLPCVRGAVKPFSF